MFGSLLDVVFLVGIATANTVLLLAAFVILLSFSTNIARGPFQGYVPDLVAEPQVGLASGLVGMMQIIGNVTGFLLVSISRRVRTDGPGAARGRDRRAGDDGQRRAARRQGACRRSRARAGHGRGSRARPGRPTSCRSGRTCGCSSSRLLFLTGGALLANFVVIYLSRTFGMSKTEANNTNVVLLIVIVIATVLAIFPGVAAVRPDRAQAADLGFLRDRGVGITIAALSPSVPVAFVGAALFGASGGMFLAVDWALMTDIIPRASAGRYMGLSNVATGAATPLAIALGGVVLDAVTGRADWRPGHGSCSRWASSSTRWPRSRCARGGAASGGASRSAGARPGSGGLIDSPASGAAARAGPTSPRPPRTGPAAGDPRARPCGGPRDEPGPGPGGGPRRIGPDQPPRRRARASWNIAASRHDRGRRNANRSRCRHHEDGRPHEHSSRADQTVPEPEQHLELDDRQGSMASDSRPTAQGAPAPPRAFGWRTGHSSAGTDFMQWRAPRSARRLRAGGLGPEQREHDRQVDVAGVQAAGDRNARIRSRIAVASG